MKAGESMRRNFAQILKDAKIDIKVEYQKLYGMLYDRSIQVSNTNRISVYDELSTFFIAFHFRGTCLSLDEFNDLHGFHFEKDPTNFNIDHLISLCEYIENLLIAYQCVSLSYPYEYGNMPTNLIRLMMCGRGIIICQSMCAGMYWAYIMKSTIGRRKSISSTIAVEN